MANCWWCHWGWPEPIAAIYREALDALGGDSHPLLYGPAHVVWEDENFERPHVLRCLELCDQEHELTDREIAVVRRSLEKLLEVDECFTKWPAGYYDNHPEMHPPPAGWVMSSKPE